MAGFDDGKDDGALRTIGEVGEALGIKAHVLRYWEAQFPMLQPLKRSGGRRYYRAEDVALVREIDRLVNREGYTLRGAKAALKGFDPAGEIPRASTTFGTAGAGEVANPPPAGLARVETVARLRAVRDRLSNALSS